MKPFLGYIKKKNLRMMLSLSLLLILVSAVAVIANPANPYVPEVSIRHEAVANHGGHQIHRMVVSARAPAGFSVFGIIVSYDNRVILPVNSDSHTDITPPTNTTVHAVTSEPFSVLATGFTETPDAWLTRNYRTGFSFDVFTIEGGVTSNALTDVFAFYYRIVGSGDGAFRIEDGRYAGSMVGIETQVSFVRPGVKMQSGGTTYIWGPNTAEHGYTEINDGNIILTGGQAPDPTPTPTPSPTPSPTPQGTPNPSSSPEPSTTPVPGSSPSPTSTPGTTPAPGGGSDARPNPSTNPLAISFSIFGAVVMLGLASTGIFSLTKKHKAQASQYDADMARHNREQRITDMLDK